MKIRDLMHKSKSSMVWVRFALAVSPLIIHNFVHAQEELRIVSVVDAPQIYDPLSYAAKALAEQTNSVITFEEMIFEYPADFQEFNDQGFPVRIPRYGAFDFEYSSGTPVPDILEALLEKYSEDYPGHYKILEDEIGSSYFHIIPDASKNEVGEYVARESLLDEILTLNMTNVTGSEIVCEVLKQVSEQENVKFFVCLA
jgi:hypothetical protein